MQQKKIRIEFLIHDLKIPLTIIETGVLSLLKRQEKYGTLKEKQEEVLMRVLRNTKSMRSMVNDALELGRSTEGIINLKRFTVSDLITTVLMEIFDLVDLKTSERVKDCKNLPRLCSVLAEKRFSLSVKEALWGKEVSLDRVKVQQILRNLLSNALKYRKSYIELRIFNDPEHLFFSVQDDGEGIPHIYHKKIFNSYFQMNPKDPYNIRGHGLGLAGVLVLLENMGGELMLESEEGQGAKFTAKIPLKGSK